MDNFQKEIDERANLALSNKFELLLFRLGSDQLKGKSELFGINVFKLREIVPMPTITKAAGMRSPLLGMASIRGQFIPVIDLPAVAGCVPETGLNLLLVTEYARNTQAFAVESVENIVRLDWSQVHTAEAGIGGRNITSIACWTVISRATSWRWCWTLSKSCMTSSHRCAASNRKRPDRVPSTTAQVRWRLWQKIPKSRVSCWSRV